MKKTILALALAAGLTSFAGSAKADIIMSNLNNSGVSESTSDANIWLKLSQPQNGLFNTITLYGASGQTTAISFNVFQWDAGNNSGEILPQLTKINGVEINSGNGTSAYDFSIPSSLQSLIANNNGTALEIRDILSTGSGFYQSDDSSIASTIVNPAFSSIITPGGQEGAENQQYQGANYQFSLEKVAADTAAVPEPSQVAASMLLVAGIAGFVIVKRRKEASSLEALAA
jgi:hypothetical protein